MLNDQRRDSKESLPFIGTEEAETVDRYTSLGTGKRSLNSPKIALAAVTGLLLGLGTGLTLALLLQTHLRCQASTLCVCRQEETSPLLDDITIKYHEQTFNGSFVHRTIYRQDASPTVDAAWDALGVNCKSAATKNLESAKSY